MRHSRYGARLAVFVAAAGLFGIIAWSVFAAEAADSLDRWAIAWARAHSAQWLTDVMLGASLSGGPSATSIYTLLIGFYLLWRRRFQTALVVAVVVYGGMLLNVVAKHVFERARPIVENLALTIDTYSFPSGHAAASTIFAGLICMLFFKSNIGQAARVLAITTATIWVGSVCVSRVYLSLHFATDVLAGIAEGIAWLALSTLLRSRMAQRSS